MRSKFINLLLLPVLAVVLSGLAGCSRGGESDVPEMAGANGAGTPATREQIIGKWQARLPSGGLLNVEFRADGTTLMTSPTIATMREEGQWEIREPGKVRMWKTDPSAVSTNKASIEGDTLHVTHNDGRSESYNRLP